MYKKGLIKIQNPFNKVDISIKIKLNKHFNSWITAVLLYPLICIIGVICQIYSYDRYDSYFMAGFFIHGYLVVRHPFEKYSLKSILYSYITGFLGAYAGYLCESNSIVVAIMAVHLTLYFTSTPSKKGIEFEALDKKEQKKITNKNWLKSTAIGIVVFYMMAQISGTLKTMVNNDMIVSKLKNCASTKLITFKDKDAIAMAKCYKKNKKLDFIRYYSINGLLDSVYKFDTNKKLDYIKDYSVGKNRTYLQYIIYNIKQTNKANIYKGIRTYLKPNGKTNIKEKTQIIMYHIEDKITLYIKDGLQIYYDKNGRMKDIANIYKNDKLIDSKILTKEDKDIFK